MAAATWSSSGSPSIVLRPDAESAAQRADRHPQPEREELRPPHQKAEGDLALLFQETVVRLAAEAHTADAQMQLTGAHIGPAEASSERLQEATPRYATVWGACRDTSFPRTAGSGNMCDPSHALADTEPKQQRATSAVHIHYSARAYHNVKNRASNGHDKSSNSGS